MAPTLITTMKSIAILTAIAASSLVAFIASLALGVVSLPVFLAAAMSWIVLLTVYAYTPNRRRSWLPRAAQARLIATNAERASLPLAA